jgi:hypothetical protein
MSKPLTTTDALPVRKSAEHYQMESQSKERPGRVYDLVFNHERQRWTCNCPDTRHSHNARCKHIRRLVAWINEQKIQAEATAVLEQAMSTSSAVSVEAAEGGIGQEYREYATAGQAPGYVTELEERVAALEARVLATECEIALTADQGERQVKELREQLLEERERSLALEELLQQVQVHLLQLAASQQALLQAVETLSAKVNEVAQVEPVRISAQTVVVESTTKARRQPAGETEAPSAEQEAPIQEIRRDGRIVGCMVGPYKVFVVRSMAIACTCERGQDGRPCKHGEVVDAYLAKKREEAPLHGNGGFQMMR